MNLRKSLFILSLLALCTAPAFAQKKKGKKGEEEVKPTASTPAPAKPKSDVKTIEEITKKCKTFKGLFNVYQDTTDGSAYMLVEADKLGKEFIYFRFIMDGSVAAGHFRGNYMGNDIITFRKYFNQIEVIKPNTGFYFDPSNAISKASNANVVPAIMVSEAIVAQDSSKTQYLIKADNIFLNESLEQLKYYSENPRAFKLGGLSKSKTKYLGVRSYPANTDISVEYVYDNPMPTVWGGPSITDPRYVSVSVQHSFIEVPQNDFQPRPDDPRIGYFTQQIDDMTASGDATPYKDVINRWFLKKKDAVKSVSEPVEPITWWIENTTPKEYRDAVRQGVLAWNKAFEKAGFKHAMVVKDQPDDADWDAGDIRYNVLRWTSSPQSVFLGYGPSFTNPRTGQILGADIMLEYGVFGRYQRFARLLEAHAHDYQSNELIEMERQSMVSELSAHLRYCSFAEHLKDNLLLGEAVLKAEGLTPAQLKGLQEQAMLELVMHEVGHTLGLNHNMKGSQLYSPTEIHDMSKTTNTGISNSVMDYMGINLASDRTKQGHYFSVNVGPYDEWAIEYGYTPDINEGQLKEIASRSSQRELMFGNDADDMRAPGFGIDPRVMIDDNSSDAVTYSADRMAMITSLLPGLKSRFATNGESYQELVGIYSSMMLEYSRAAGVVSRYVGGVYVERGMQGEAGATQPFTPAPYETQKKAMSTLHKYLFAPDAFKVPSELLNYLQLQRRGYNFYGATEDPKVHRNFLAMQRNALAHLIHPTTLHRIVDSQLYGNKYRIDEFMMELYDAIFKEDLYAASINSFRQNLQLEYVNALIGMASGTNKDMYPYQARSLALHQLNLVLSAAKAGTGDVQTKAHKEHLKYIIEIALKG